MGIRRAGLRVPEDISVTGFDNFGFGDNFDPAFCDPPLTTLANPGFEIGYRAFEQLEKLCSGERGGRRGPVHSSASHLRKSAAAPDGILFRSRPRAIWSVRGCMARWAGDRRRRCPWPNSHATCCARRWRKRMLRPPLRSSSVSDLRGFRRRAWLAFAAEIPRVFARPARAARRCRGTQCARVDRRGQRGRGGVCLALPRLQERAKVPRERGAFHLASQPLHTQDLRRSRRGGGQHPPPARHSIHSARRAVERRQCAVRAVDAIHGAASGL